jgi:hypothetical protein
MLPTQVSHLSGYPTGVIAPARAGHKEDSQICGVLR